MSPLQKKSAEIFYVFLRLGLTSFGGPIAHLGYFRRELVEKRQWLSEEQYAQLLAICQFLPGPASSQLGFSIGLLCGGLRGALAAFIAFTTPSALLLIAFASLLPYLSSPEGQAIIHGLKLVALAVVAHGVWGMQKSLCPDLPRRTLAIVTAVIMLLTASAAMQLISIIGCGLAGIVLCKNTGQDEPAAPVSFNYSSRYGTASLILFLLLLVVLPGLPGTGGDQAGLLHIMELFYRSGALVFGGGHVVLPLLEEATVRQGLLPEQLFLAGYGAAQAIPGPMFSFAAFIGWVMEGEHHAALKSSVALGSIFLPGFLLLLGILPFWQKFSRQVYALRAIAGINASVVGLLAAALYNPIYTSSVHGGADLVIGASAFILLQFMRISALGVVAWCVLGSLAMTLF